MVYDRLNSAVDGLALGNGTVYNFINYIGRKHLTGGIARYTLNRGYFFNNVSSNYETGLAGRYGYGSGAFEDTDAKDKIEGSDVGLYVKDGQIMKSSHSQDRIGDFYMISGPMGNGEKSFLTLNDFSYLADELRFQNTQYNVNQDHFKDTHLIDYNQSKFISDGFPTQVEEGDEIVNTKFSGQKYEQLFERTPLFYQDISRNKWGLLVNYNKPCSYVETIERDRYIAPTLVNSLQKKPTPKETGKSLLEGYVIRGYFKNNKVVSSSPDRLPKSYYKSSGVVYENFGDYYVTIGEGEPARVPTIDNDGLFDYYGEEREKYSTKSTFWYGKSYGVSTNEQPENYKIGDGVYAKKATVDRSFKGGSFRTNGIEPNQGDYDYYEESDNGASVKSFKSTSTSEGFTPSIDSFDNGSRIMKNMNKMFANNEIKSLINRFHSDKNVDKDDQLISAYSEYGLSRGRNLLKKQHNDDNVTGFENPYCRVWTAHYQYSKMKDRIRPFMDGGTFMSIKELQSNLGKLRPNNGAQRLNDNSVLMDSGFVKITPFNKDGQLSGGRDSLKKYMFSIENLAWKNFATPDRLANEQIGPFGGRIMWFPPYNIKFTENINVSWKDNDFIGRGEKIYTYVNTDRGGTLSFSLLIDHPSILNKAVGTGDNSGVSDEDILRFFAGCGVLEPAAGAENNDDNNNESVVEPEDDNVTPRHKPDQQFIEKNFVVFYPNNFSAKKYYSNMAEVVSKLDQYEMSNNARAFTEMDIDWEKQKLQEINYDNMSRYNLNFGNWSDELKSLIAQMLPVGDIEELGSYDDLKTLNVLYNYPTNDGSTGIFGLDTRDYEIDSIEVCGFASDHGYPEYNEILAKDRRETIKRLAKYFCATIDNDKFVEGETREIPIREVGHEDNVNEIKAKIARSAVIKFKIKLRDDVTPSIDGDNEGVVYVDDEEPVVEETQETQSDNTQTGEETREVVLTFHGGQGAEPYYYTYQNEFLYFKEIEATHPLEHKKIVDKVKFFNPAFHSLTPEGFNARLNFLQQCTRQGPTIGSHSGDENKDGSNTSKMAGNLSFGMAPYCILRVGDFYYSKIVIDSLSIDYDNSGGPQWDLNPEGVGVQPMFANINMNFHFIGGQDIEGPVAQLQNALSYNYYANSSVYTPETQNPIPTVEVK